MPSLKEIKGRIASVNSTRKITSAMKMVASSKLHHAQVAIENMLPYEEMLEHILKSFLASEAELRSTFLQARPVKRVALIVYSSNSSLCGGFNANIIKEMQKTIDQYEHLGKENIIIYPIGRKVAEKAAKLGFEPAGNFTALADKPNVDDCITIAKEIGDLYSKGEVDRVEMIYHHFKSAGSQILTHKTFLPIDLESELNADKERDLTSNVATREAVEYLKNRDRQQEDQQKAAAKPINDNFIVDRTCIRCSPSWCLSWRISCSTRHCSTPWPRNMPPVWWPCRPPRIMPTNCCANSICSTTRVVSRPSPTSCSTS